MLDGDALLNFLLGYSMPFEVVTQSPVPNPGEIERGKARDCWWLITFFDSGESLTIFWRIRQRGYDPEPNGHIPHFYWRQEKTSHRSVRDE